MSDLAAIFDAHVAAEFQDLDLEATMETMTDDPYVHHEHIYWDQATVLVQAGLLDTDGLPVVGSEQAEALLDQTRSKNELFADSS